MAIRNVICRGLGPGALPHWVVTRGLGGLGGGGGSNIPGTAGAYGVGTRRALSLRLRRFQRRHGLRSR